MRGWSKGLAMGALAALLMGSWTASAEPGSGRGPRGVQHLSQEERRTLRQEIVDHNRGHHRGPAGAGRQGPPPGYPGGQPGHAGGGHPKGPPPGFERRR